MSIRSIPLTFASALLALSMAMLAAPARAQGQQSWVACADEGQTCQITGDAMVRFGSDTRFAFRVTRTPLPCNIEAFGADPAPGVRKRCEVSLNWRGDPRYRGWREAGAGAADGTRWRHCADEGAECLVNGAARVRFGIGERFNVLQANGRVACNIGTFRDPAPGLRKVCEVEETGTPWILCANEGDLCRLAGTGVVRYGAAGRYVEKSATYEIPCTNTQFGDPLPGTAKQCEYRGAGAGAVAAGLPWEFCAREDGQCNFRGPGMLRYGASGRYVYREAYDGSGCRNEDFGADPAPGLKKQCELLRMWR